MKLALKLDKIFCCERCRAMFLFRSDVEDYAAMCGHGQVREMDLA
jgi:hypothetical protein